MKTTIVALAAAALVAATPDVLAQNVSSKVPNRQHQISEKRPHVASGYAPGRVVHAKGMKTGYPGPFGYSPAEPKDYTYESSRQAGGGGGGSGM